MGCWLWCCWTSMVGDNQMFGVAFEMEQGTESWVLRTTRTVTWIRNANNCYLKRPLWCPNFSFWFVSIESTSIEFITSSIKLRSCSFTSVVNLFVLPLGLGIFLYFYHKNAYIKRVIVLSAFWSALYVWQFFNEHSAEMELSNIFYYTFLTSLFFLGLGWIVSLFSEKHKFKSIDIGIGIMIGFFITTEVRMFVYNVFNI